MFEEGSRGGQMLMASVQHNEQCVKVTVSVFLINSLWSSTIDSSLLTHTTRTSILALMGFTNIVH